jgi:hypothetical protein
MLNDHERQLLNDVERHLEHEDPSWMSRFSRHYIPRLPPLPPRSFMSHRGQSNME